MDRRRFGVLLATGMAGAVASCQSREVISSAPSVVLKVSAAASLKAAMEQVKVAYARANSSVGIAYNFGASGALAQQIVQGAAVDVFVSAAPSWMDLLADKKLLLEKSRRNLLQNSLVLIIPESNDAVLSTVFAFEELESSRFKKIAIGEPNSVPVGRYAEEFLRSAGLYDKLRSKLVLGKDSSQVLIYVAARQVDAGIVYATDAQKTDGVRLMAEIKADTHSPILYPVAVVKNSQHLSEAQAFVDFLFGKVAAEFFLADGFKLDR